MKSLLRGFGTLTVRNYKQLRQSHWVTLSGGHPNCRTHKVISDCNNRCLVQASNDGHFPCSGVRNCPGLSCGLLIATRTQLLPNSLTDSPTNPLTECSKSQMLHDRRFAANHFILALNTRGQWQQISFLQMNCGVVSSLVLLVKPLFCYMQSLPLPNNGCCACFAVVA
jgi:hypothetical protein